MHDPKFKKRWLDFIISAFFVGKTLFTNKISYYCLIFRYPVSNFSYRLLDQMSVDPLFNVGDINPGLYRKNRQLEKCRDLRLQLFFLKSFVLTCRFAVT